MANWTTEVLTTYGTDREKWRSFVNRLPDHCTDVYFYPEFASINEHMSNEPTFLFRYGDDDDSVLMVLARKKISDLSFTNNGTDLPAGAGFDVATPYGYGGPVLHSKNPDNAVELFRGFRNAFHEYCKEERIVTEFLRLHPLIQNYQLFDQDPNLVRKNSTVWINLRVSESEILSRMRNDPRRSIKISENKGVQIILSDLNKRHVDEFYTLYTNSMDRLHAGSFYYFPKDFFYDLADMMSKNIALFLAVWEGRVIAAYWFFHCGIYVDMYLAGSDSNYWDLKANALTIYKAALWAKSQGYSSVHLGGGLGVEFDNLFHFKSQFSPERSPFYTYRFVHDQDAYAQISKLKKEYDENVRGLSHESLGSLTESEYFPIYRG